MAGDEGTPVSLRVRPSDGGKPMRVTLVRRSIAEPVVASRTIRAGGGRYQYLRLFGFPGLGRPVGAPAGPAGRPPSRRRPHPRPARQSRRPPVAGGRRLARLRRPRCGRHARSGPPRAGAVLLCERHRGRQAAAGRPDRRIDRERRRGDGGSATDRRRRDRGRLAKLRQGHGAGDRAAGGRRGAQADGGAIPAGRARAGRRPRDRPRRRRSRTASAGRRRSCARRSRR